MLPYPLFDSKTLGILALSFGLIEIPAKRSCQVGAHLAETLDFH